jgi:glycosyltransferase involved in cell wall biosynthesis
MKTLVFDMTILDTPTRSRGTARYVRDLAAALMGLDHAERRGLRLLGLTGLTWTGGYRIVEDLSSFAGSPGVSSPAARDHYRWAYQRRLVLSLALRRIGADAVHLTDPNATPLGLRASRIRRIVTCHDTIPLLYPDRYFGIHDGGPWIGRKIEQRRFRTADLVVAISDAVVEDAVRLLGVRRERLVRVYNAIDATRWTESSTPDAERDTQARFGLHRPYVLYFGGPDWHKNVEGMFAGLAATRGAGTDVELAWAGRLPEDALARMQELARSAGVLDAVRFLGFVTDTDLRHLLRQARAHVLVSHTEGFGFTVLEAMAAGCAVITTRRGSLGEVAGDAALMVDGDDAASIGRAITRLCTDEALRTDLIRRGLERPSRFSPRTQALEMIAAYERALESPPVFGGARAS